MNRSRNAFSDTNRVTRRRFLKSTAAIAASTFAAPAILPAGGVINKLNIAVIGAGGRGAANLAAVAGTDNIVTLCDVNENNLNKAAANHPKARTLVDFRKIFDRPQEIDAVIVSTCEH